MDDIFEPTNLLEETNIKEEAKVQLTGVALWSKILAIGSLAGLAISLINVFVVNSKISNASVFIGSLVGVLITGAISIVINITLLNFSKNVSIAIEDSNQNIFEIAFTKLSNYFKINGILTIIALVFVVFAVIIGIFVGMAGGFGK